MMAQMDPKEFDRVRMVVTAAQNILEAAENDRQTASKLLTRLEALEGRVELVLGQIPRTIEGSLTRLASATAEDAAGRLSEKFVGANKAASDLTRLYLAASSKLRRKYWIALTVSQLVVALILSATAYFFIPSKEEIANRRYQLAELERSIVNLNKGKK